MEASPGASGSRLGIALAGAILAGVVMVLAWLFGRGPGGLLYAAAYLLALVPGLPVGFTLFGRKQAAGWVAGGLVGYMLTALALWAAIAAGAPRVPVMLASWAVVAAVAWGPYLVRRPEPLVSLPSWRRRDTLALLLVLLLVPALLAPTVSRIGAKDEAGNERYRAYFTADFLWHAALTAELARFDMPPRDPYAADQTLNYYWAYFILPGSALGTNPFGLWPAAMPLLKVNLLLSGLLFIGMLACFAWAIAPRAWAVAAAVSLSVLAASAEGSYAIFDAVSRGRGLDSLRQLNIDAITAWVFQSLTVDGLQRSLWYTPQHAMSCALGLVALTAAAGSHRGDRLAAALLAGVALGGALACSPLLGGSFSLIYGASVLITRRAGWRETARAAAVHATAAGPVLLALAWCVWNQSFEGAGAAVAFGFSGPIARAPFVMPALALGPLIVAAAAGLCLGRQKAGGALGPAVAGVAIGFVLLYFVTMPGGDVVWIGWRAGQILLLTMTPLAALGFAWASDAGRYRGLAIGVAALLFALGLPTTVIDTYNAQDIWNRRMGPGFRWTILVTPDERRAFDWIQRETPATSVVQMEVNARGRETWSQIPTFAGRRTAAGLPISLLRKPLYTERSDRVHALFEAGDAAEAQRLAQGLGIDYLYMDSTERRAFGASLRKFDEHPELFERVYQGGEVSIYRVRGPGQPS